MNLTKTEHGEWKAFSDYHLKDARWLRLSAVRASDKQLRVRFTVYTLDGNFAVFAPYSDYNALVYTCKPKRMSAKVAEDAHNAYVHLVSEHIKLAKQHYNIVD